MSERVQRNLYGVSGVSWEAVEWETRQNEYFGCVRELGVDRAGERETDVRWADGGVPKMSRMGKRKIGRGDSRDRERAASN